MNALERDESLLGGGRWGGLPSGVGQRIRGAGSDSGPRTRAQGSRDESSSRDALARLRLGHDSFKTPATWDTFSDRPASWALSLSMVGGSTVTPVQRGDG